MIYRILLVCNIIFTATTLFSQNDFRDGFIITLQNDTIFGNLEYFQKNKKYEFCNFRKDGVTTKYKPDKILGYGFKEDKLFSSKIIEGSFVEVLIIGELSLFRHERKYHLQKKDKRYTLVSKIDKVEKDGVTTYKENNKWKGILVHLINDCLTLSSKSIENLNFYERTITKLVIRYNECKGVPYTEVKINKPWVKFDFGATVGYNNITLKSEKNEFDFAPHIATTYQTNAFSFGLVMELLSPKINDRLAFRIEPQYFESEYNGLVVLDKIEKEIHDTYFKFKTITTPLGLIYKVPINKKFNFYPQAGVNFDYHIESEVNSVTTKIKNGVVRIENERTAFRVKKSQFGYWAGIGVGKDFKKFSGSISTRYYYIPTLNEPSGFETDVNRFSLNLTFVKK